MTGSALHIRPPRVNAVLILVAFLLVLLAGISLRNWVWSQTAPIRFRGDVSNAMKIGTDVNLLAYKEEGQDPRTATRAPSVSALIHAYLNRYDWAYELALAKLHLPVTAPSAETELPDDHYKIDYPPGRLAIACLWVHHLYSRPELIQRDEKGRVRYSDTIVTPLRRVNMVHEAIAALGAYVLCRRVLRDAGRSRKRATFLAAFAALLLWFNPAAILIAHGWPQWDVWVLPYAIWAMYCAVTGRWMGVGALIVLGGMFKGQVLLIAPFFVCWPMFQRNTSGLLRLFAGAMMAAGLCAAPWMLRTPEAWGWLAGVALILAASLTCAHRLPSITGDVKPSQPMNLQRLLSLCAVTLSLTWLVVPFSNSDHRSLLPWAVLLATMVLVLPRVWHGRKRAITALVLGLATLVAGARFDGSFAWYRVGFQTNRHPHMMIGHVANLPVVLKKKLQLQVDHPVNLPLVGPIELRVLLRGVSTSLLALLALAAARAVRRDKPAQFLNANLLVILPAAWVVIYAIMPQMHERYLLWAAATSALLATRSVAGFVIHVALTTICVTMVLASMVNTNNLIKGEDMPSWIHAVNRIQTPLGCYIFILALGLVVWSCLREKRHTLQPPTQPS